MRAAVLGNTPQVANADSQEKNICMQRASGEIAAQVTQAPLTAIITHH
jgi:hypothetical protein